MHPNNNRRCDDSMASADKEMEERAKRAKELLSQRYKGLKHEQVSVNRWKVKDHTEGDTHLGNLNYSLKILRFWKHQF